jgi:putative heme-binding domain-containing protein
VDSRFVSSVATATDGKVYTGLIRAETGTTVTLTGLDGIDTTLLRSQVESLESTGRSLMPEGLERAVSPQAMADVLAFLRQSAR